MQPFDFKFLTIVAHISFDLPRCLQEPLGQLPEGQPMWLSIKYISSGFCLIIGIAFRSDSNWCSRAPSRGDVAAELAGVDPSLLAASAPSTSPSVATWLRVFPIGCISNECWFRKQCMLVLFKYAVRKVSKTDTKKKTHATPALDLGAATHRRPWKVYILNYV